MPSIDKQIIYKSFLLHKDADAISRLCKRHGYALTFRETGAATLARLRKGAGAKPHDILAKTVKGGRSSNQKRLSVLTRLSPGHSVQLYKKLEGFVGHDDIRDGKLRGPIFTTSGKTRFANAYRKHPERIKRIGTSGRYYLDLNNADTLGFFLRTNLKASYFFSGDYDLHDIIKGHYYLVEDERSTDGGTQLSHFRDLFNAGLRAGTDGRGISDKDYRRIQHGAQFSYLSFTITHEVGKGEKPTRIYKTVVQASFPLAACNCEGKWNILKNMVEYQKWIARFGLAVKGIWLDRIEFDKFLRRTSEVYGPRVELVG